jgi:putative hydroxymethylpyrimidine transport system permease protein
VQPALVFSQAVPVFALAPILMLWLGYGLWSKVAVAVLIIYFPVASTFLDGLLRTPQGYLDLAHCMGATPRRTMWRVRIPAALPALASGLRLAAVYAPIGAVIGEWVGASRGLGYLMLFANGRARIDLMFAALLVLAVLTILLHAAVDAAARRLQARIDDVGTPRARDQSRRGAWMPSRRRGPPKSRVVPSVAARLAHRDGIQRKRAD